MPASSDSTAAALADAKIMDAGVYSCVKLCHVRLEAGAAAETLSMLSAMLVQFRPGDEQAADLQMQLSRARGYISAARKLLAEATGEAERLAGILKPQKAPNAAESMETAPKDRVLLLWLPLAVSWQLGRWRTGGSERVGDGWTIHGHSTEEPTWWLSLPCRPHA